MLCFFHNASCLSIVAFRYTSTTTYTSTITPTCYTTDLLVLGRACTIKTILGVVQVGGKRRRKRSEDVVETRPVVSVDGVEVDYDELIRPHKVRTVCANAGCFSSDAMSLEMDQELRIKYFRPQRWRRRSREKRGIWRGPSR